MSLCTPGRDAHGFIFGMCPPCAGEDHQHHHGQTSCQTQGCACTGWPPGCRCTLDPDGTRTTHDCPHHPDAASITPRPATDPGGRT